VKIVSFISFHAYGVALICAAGFASCAQHIPLQNSMKTTQIAPDDKQRSQFVRDFVENVFNAHDPSAGPTYLQPDFKVINGFLGVRSGRDAYLTAITRMAQTFPDLHATVEDAFASGDRVAIRLTIEGTQRAPLWGIPATNKKLRWTGNNIYRLENGKIAEEWASEDWLALFIQLDQFHPPAPQ